LQKRQKNRLLPEPLNSVLCAKSKMVDLKNKIILEAEKINLLYEKVNKTFKKRNKNRIHWEEACKQFNAYITVFSPLLMKIYNEKYLSNQDVIEFTISYLEVDPMYFRSGYIKEEMLRKIKRTSLNEKQKYRLRNLLYNAVEERASREYKRYCSLGPMVTDEKFNNWLINIIQNEKGSKKSRADLMLKQINNHEST